MVVVVAVTTFWVNSNPSRSSRIARRSSIDRAWKHDDTSSGFCWCSILCVSICLLLEPELDPKKAMCFFFSVAATPLLWVDFDFFYVSSCVAQKTNFRGTPWSRNLFVQVLLCWIAMLPEIRWMDQNPRVWSLWIYKLQNLFGSHSLWLNYLMSLMTSYFMIILHRMWAETRWATRQLHPWDAYDVFSKVLGSGSMIFTYLSYQHIINFTSSPKWTKANQDKKRDVEGCSFHLNSCHRMKTV